MRVKNWCFNHQISPVWDHSTLVLFAKKGFKETKVACKGFVPFWVQNLAKLTKFISSWGWLSFGVDRVGGVVNEIVWHILEGSPASIELDTACHEPKRLGPMAISCKFRKFSTIRHVRLKHPYSPRGGGTLVVTWLAASMLLGCMVNSVKNFHHPRPCWNHWKLAPLEVA